MITLTLPAGPKWPDIEKLECYYFPRMKLSPPVIWKVMAGSMLGRFLDQCEITIGNGNPAVLVDGLRYVHGRAEVAKGNPVVSTVLLVKPISEEPVHPLKWITYLPAIYEEFWRAHGEREKTS